MELPKNIYFYWDTLEIPEEALNNVKNYKAQNRDFNVKILNDEDINIYKNEFPELIELFHLATISALKADIIRLIFLYKEGGIWIDMNTTLEINDGIKILYDRYKQYDFVITIQPTCRNDLKTSCLISKINSKLAYDTIIKMTENLKRHYELEKKSQEYISYNFFLFVAPVVFFDLLEYHYDDEFRKKINNEFIKDNDNNIITLKSKKFEEYNCGLMDVDPKLLHFYGCNMSHHHGENFHKHWSNLQKTQKLFF
uniref:Uncharacterized protein n=1 Tax=viral metagenome TaxID=1070528 RepID=A0A6C0EK22_9ZZZZ